MGHTLLFFLHSRSFLVERAIRLGLGVEELELLLDLFHRRFVVCLKAYILNK
jgi:hypothetical protein